MNPPSSRFCSSCGAPVGASLPPPAPAGAAGLGLFAAAAPLVGSPVLGIASQLADQATRRSCDRCGGANSTDMSFCQFCGARLDAGLPVKAGGQHREALPSDTAARPWITPQEFPGAGAGRALKAEPAARLVVIAQDGTPGRDYPLTTEQTDVGREEGAILLPNDPYVSPRHARVTRKNSRFYARDLGSVNGLYVRLRRPSKLEHADLVLIGLEVLRFEVVSDAEKGLGPAAERGAHVFGSPSSPRYARLCQRTVEGVTRDVFYLTRDETVIGREAGDIVFTSDPFMSRRHAAVTRDSRDNSFSLRDLGSSNGTYLAIRGEIELENGDHIRIGQHLFRLDVDPGGQI